MNYLKTLATNCFLKSISAIIIALASFSSGYAQVINTFDNPDISQWILEGDGDLLHNASNGNPGGCLLFDDDATGATAVMVVPPAYLGVWNDDAQDISFDFKVVTSDPEIIDDFPWVFEISGPGGLAQALPNYAPVSNTWLNISVPISQADWTVVSGSWEDIIANVNQVRIRVEYIDGVEDVYLDNIALSFTPPANEISGDVCSDFETYGFDGWTFANVGTLTYSETEGNPAGTIKIGDKSNVVGQGYAPWKFLGDWSVLGANALLNFDLRINSSSSSLFIQKEYLVKISGSGGTAIIPADYVEIAGALNQWKSFSIPIDESEWTVTSGTWAGLINNVQQLVLEMEFIQGGETELIDNVCLLTDNSPCTADGGAISPSIVATCSKETYTMSSTGFTPDPAATFQWMTSTTSGGPYSNVSGGSGATTTSYTTGKLNTGTYYYVLKATCPAAGTDLSNELTITVNGLPSATVTPSGSTTFCSGGTVTLSAPVAGNRAYKWKKGSNDIAGATLSSYTATGKGKYKVVVTNTSTGCSKTSSTTEVTVNALPTATITPQGPTTFCEGGSVVLQANTGAGLTYKWKKGSNYISGATLSSYTATEQGNYKVEVTDANSCSKTSSSTAVTINCREGENLVTSNDDRIFIYPNPSSGEFLVNIKFEESCESIKLEIVNTSGQNVYSEDIGLTGGKAVKEISLPADIAAGVYWLRILDSECITYEKKLVIQY